MRPQCLSYLCLFFGVFGSCHHHTHGVALLHRSDHGLQRRIEHKLAVDLRKKIDFWHWMQVYRYIFYIYGYIFFHRIVYMFQCLETVACQLWRRLSNFLSMHVTLTTERKVCYMTTCSSVMPLWVDCFAETMSLVRYCCAQTVIVGGKRSLYRKGS